MKSLTMLTSIALFSSVAAAKDHTNVLMVVSSYGEVNQNQELVKPGYEFGELSKAYHVFKRHGIQVTIASPSGGEPIADEYDKSAIYNQKFLNDKTAVASLTNSYKLADIDASKFDGIFVVGGKGPMFDLHQHEPLKQTISKVYENSGVVAGVCHGPAAFVDVKLSDGSYLVEGKRVNGFTNAEEHAFGSKWLKDFPFLLQDKLEERGAKFEQDGVMLNQVTVDGRLITGQNPFSTVDTARAMVTAMGVELLSAQPYQDDASVNLYELFLRDQNAAIQKLEATPALYDMKMLAMLSVFQIKHATTEYQVDASAQLLEYVLPKFSHPVLAVSLAQAYVRMNQSDKALKVLQSSAKQFPENEKIKSFMASL
ncbi:MULTISPECIES: DJ-1/PfpI family protein [Pseudoalteromonas]|uniref:DJ-1/PfpI family protein n=1 Tax=Pseudoalteromonas obscura TaxID=3048491 RepID=A0ABT7ELZ2_9GAMM|nr:MULTISPECIES: DJ-1/PfpI family protein [Pseudoalteromonas]MBQ4837985.1 type 1 glutamine amidotransferase domain-containing protein [Pseudoalteromonas luteoviolacea]MDK2596067.1 DJ-1/PfpI family protein [Pseudoalteromonas sp. P94(2023)]